MASTSLTCGLLVQTTLGRNATYRAVDVSAIQEMPADLRRTWVEAITDDASRAHVYERAHHISRRIYFLDLNGYVSVSEEYAGPDTGEAWTHYRPLEEVITALTPIDSGEASARSPPLEQASTALSSVEQNGQLQRHASVSSEDYDFSANSEHLQLLHRAVSTHGLAHHGAISGPLIYTSLKTLAKIHENLRHLGPALIKKLKDLSTWIRAHPYQTAGIVGGTALFILACCTPLILGAAGFSSIGPVAGSAAAAWQASMGSVAAGSLFAFLQSAAMGGAAMGVFVGVGAVGGGIAVAGVLAASDGVVEKVKGFVGKEVVQRVGPVVDGVKGFVNGSKTRVFGVPGVVVDKQQEECYRRHSSMKYLLSKAIQPPFVKWNYDSSSNSATRETQASLTR